MDLGAGRLMYLRCSGQGAPTVILESGYYDSSDLWWQAEPLAPSVGPAMQERLSERVRVCSYDRPGTIRYT